MTPDGLRELAETYGADPARWPDSIRAEAQASLARLPAPPAWLAEAKALDAWLDTFPAPAAGPALARRIVLAAPDLTPLWRRARAWWTGLGLAGAAAAGLAAGALVVLAVTPPAASPSSDYVYDQTAFGDLAGQEG